MNYKEVKELVEYYEERIVNNFDKYLGYLVLEDFYSGGGDVGRIEDKFFYEEYYSRYEDGIIDLLNEISDENEDYYDFQLRLIKLKRVIDTNLANVNLNDEDWDNDKPIRKSRTNTFLINPKLDRYEFIKNLYNSLLKYHFISNSEEEFNLIFKGNFNPINKIYWNGTELQITFLISKLIEQKYFDIELSNFKFKLICTYFLNKSGKDFRPKQLGSVYAEKKEMISSNDSILKVIDEMSTHF